MREAVRAFEDRHVLGAIFAPSAKHARYDSRHGTALGTRFGRRFDIIPQNVHMNIIAPVLSASAFFSDNQATVAAYRLADSGSWFSPDR